MRAVFSTIRAFKFHIEFVKTTRNADPAIQVVLTCEPLRHTSRTPTKLRNQQLEALVGGVEEANESELLADLMGMFDQHIRKSKPTDSEKDEAIPHWRYNLKNQNPDDLNGSVCTDD